MAALRNQSLDPDMLDERARILLRYRDLVPERPKFDNVERWYAAIARCR